MMRRREFIAGLGSAAAWPVAARAQQPNLPVIGFLSGGELQAHLVAVFRQGLGTTGYVENQNVLIDYRTTDEYARFPAIAAEFVRRPVNVIFAGGSAAGGLAAKAATTAIPIVFVCAEDPVTSGLVDNVNRPSGNITGASFFASPMEQKRMELLHDLLPAAKRVGVLVNASFLDARKQTQDLQDAARLFGQDALLVSASADLDFEKAFASLTEQHADVMLVGSDPFLFSRRDKIVAMAAQARIPAVYNDSLYVEAGGLMSYGTIPSDAFYQGAVYAGRILKGAKTSDLPVVLPERFELAINLKIARALDLAVPQSILLRAVKVVE